MGPETDIPGAVVGVFSYLALVGTGVFTSIAIVVLAFHLTFVRGRLVRGLALFVPREHRDPAPLLFEAFETKVGAYIRGVALWCLIVGGLACALLADWAAQRASAGPTRWPARSGPNHRANLASSWSNTR
jgi:predicted PurR-regulated permease PerM